MSSTRTAALRGLCHPIALLAVGTLLVNDHVLKAVAPSPLTGKLSDVCGLLFFPLLLTLAVAWVLPARLLRHARRVHAASIAASASAFALLKATWVGPWLAESISRHLPVGSVSIVRDPSDLLALPALAGSWLLFTSARRSRSGLPSRIRAVAVVGLASLATIATSYWTPYMQLWSELEDDRTRQRLTCYEGGRRVEYDEETGVLTEWCERRSWLGRLRRHGPWVEWYPGVRVRRLEIWYEKDVPRGPWIERFQDGKPWRAGLMEGGVRVGIWHSWSASGAELSPQCYEGGELVAPQRSIDECPEPRW